MNIKQVAIEKCVILSWSPFAGQPSEISEEAKGQKFFEADPPIAVPQNDRYLVLTRCWMIHEAIRRNLETVLLNVKDLEPKEQLLVTLQESIQEAPDPFRIASIITTLQSDHGMKPSEIADAIGKPRSSISNYLNLGKYPEIEKAYRDAESLPDGTHSANIPTLREVSRIQFPFRNDIPALLKSLQNPGIPPTAVTRVVNVINDGKLSQNPNEKGKSPKAKFLDHCKYPEVLTKLKDVPLNDLGTLVTKFNDGNQGDGKLSLKYAIEETLDKTVKRPDGDKPLTLTEAEKLIYYSSTTGHSVAVHIRDAITLKDFHNPEQQEPVSATGSFNGIQLICTSPPYNLGFRHEENLTLTEYLHAMKIAIEPAVQILSPGCWCLVNVADRMRGDDDEIILYAHHYQEMFASWGLPLRQEKIWRKPTPHGYRKDLTMNHPHGKYTSGNNFEHVLAFRKPGTRSVDPQLESRAKKELAPYFSVSVDAVWEINPVNSPVERTGHETPFPLELPKRIIRMWSFPYDVVCDPFAGSGTTGQAAVELGRHAVMFEKYSTYREAIVRRFAGTQKRERRTGTNG